MIMARTKKQILDALRQTNQTLRDKLNNVRKVCVRVHDDDAKNIKALAETLNTNRGVIKT